MGIDWIPMKLKPGVSRDQVIELINVQAKSFQANPQLWDTNLCDFYPRQETEQEQLLLQQYRQSSKSLQECLEIALDDSYRVYAITWSIILPPEWRLASHRTYLPEQLPFKINSLRSYLTALKLGHYRPYLFQLYLYETSMNLFKHWRYLQRNAEATCNKTNNWATRKSLVEIREQILQLTQPTISPAPIWLCWEQISSIVEHENDLLYCGILQSSETLIKLTKRFDSQVRGSWKLKCYKPVITFEEFTEQADNDWLNEFLAWAERCSQKQQGLYFDY